MIFEGVNDEIHNTVDQIKRFEKSTDKKTKMVSFDAETQSAEFEGSDCSIYNTTLDGCTCVDFAMRGLPCKHMYKLATECKIIDPTVEPWKTFTGYSKLLNGVKKKINNLDMKQLNELSAFVDTLL